MFRWATPGVCARLPDVSPNIADLVSECAARTPQKPALICPSRTLSWAELDRLVRAVAGGLRTIGLKRGDRVAIVVGNSPEFVSTYFGVLRAGMVAVPINTSYTSYEIGYLLSQSGASLVIADADTTAVVTQGAGDVRVITVGTGAWRSLTVGSTPPPAEEADAEDLAVLLFTSGTSGKPKGAMLSHRALGANLDQLAALSDPPAMTADDVVMVILPLFHSYALNGALGMVAKTGATAVLTERFDPIEALRLVRTHGATVVATAPPVYGAWLNLANLRESLAGVRLLISGAAPLGSDVFDAFTEAAGQPVWEGYGMTEASPVITTTLVTGSPKPGSVGRPLAGIDVELRDEQGLPVDEGDPGEIVIRGANLFSGYWPDGRDGPGDDGWWATSDVGIIDSDGDLRLVDRRNDLIIVSGFNVYPREVEDTIAKMPGVREVAVMGTQDAYTGETVKAIVVSDDDALSSTDIIDFARTRLARFKCPTIVDFVAELPHSGTGKISKGALRERIEGVRE